MERVSLYQGTREELLHEIAEVKAVVFADGLLHEDPVEDVAIRGIWGALLELLLQQLEAMDQVLATEQLRREAWGLSRDSHAG